MTQTYSRHERQSDRYVNRDNLFIGRSTYEHFVNAFVASTTRLHLCLLSRHKLGLGRRQGSGFVMPGSFLISKVRKF